MPVYLDGRLAGETRHVRVTIAFDGGSGSGAVGTVTAFTITGRVWLLGLSTFCTETLTEGGATATVSLGVASSTAGLIAQVNAVDIDNNEWWMDGTPAAGMVQMNAAQVDALLSENIILTVGAQSVDDGTFVIDVWYIPVTSDGALS